MTLDRRRTSNFMTGWFPGRPRKSFSIKKGWLFGSQVRMAMDLAASVIWCIAFANGDKTLARQALQEGKI
jgi:hypothetical protein